DHTISLLRSLLLITRPPLSTLFPYTTLFRSLRKTLERFHAGLGRQEDIDLIADLAKNMLGRTFCPLGDAAAMPTISIVQKWRGEFEGHLRGRCPYKSAGALVGAR